MIFLRPHRAVYRTTSILIAATLLATSSQAHEAWLLTPSEIVVLAQEPMPYIFTSHTILGIAAFVGCLITIVALYLEEQFQTLETQAEPLLRETFLQVGHVTLRWALAVMLVLAGTGGLPRHGTAIWTTPTLLVPDMQLSLVSGWDWLAFVQIAMALFLVIGLFTRVIGFLLIALIGAGLFVFEAKFLAYAPHFAAPALLLIVIGSGPWSLDQILGYGARFNPFRNCAQIVWRTAQILVGAGFVYLAVMYKLTQPTLLIAILQHGDLPTFGLSYPTVALLMTGVEIICGGLLIAGRLIRPVSLVIIGAITFLALTLGETPLFHANLYGSMAVFALMGRTWTASNTGTTPPFGRALA